jgi:hypothetical protein
MRTTTLIVSFLSVCLLAAAAPGAAQAQATRSWVSGVGDDANPCSRTAPCKTFSGAISKTAAGGEIDTLDPGGFGAVTITKAITIAAEGTGEASVLVSGTNGITVNAGSNDVVILRGLQIDGSPLGGLSGVKFTSGRVLEIENSTIRNFIDGSPDGNGVLFAPSTGFSQLLISDSTITTNGARFNSGGGVFIVPTGSASVQANLTRVNIVNNVVGVRADASGTTGTITLSIHDSTITQSQFAGLAAFTNGGTGFAKVIVDHSVITNNGTGLNANGGNALIQLDLSVLALNAIGASAPNGGVLNSTGNNQINNNTTAGAPITVVGPN